MTMSDLRTQIESLSAAEKAELLDAVWESLEADALSLTDEQRAELDYLLVPQVSGLRTLTWAHEGSCLGDCA